MKNVIILMAGSDGQNAKAISSVAELIMHTRRYRCLEAPSSSYRSLFCSNEFEQEEEEEN